MSGIISCRKKVNKSTNISLLPFYFRRQSRSRRYIYLVGRILNYSCKVSRQCFSRFEYVFFYSHEGPCIFFSRFEYVFSIHMKDNAFFFYISGQGTYRTPPFFLNFFFCFIEFIFIDLYIFPSPSESQKIQNFNGFNSIH